MDILIIDDEIELSDITKDFLDDNGYAVKQAFTWKEALKLLSETEFKLIILDINLPDASGFNICSEIRKKSNIPIIFISARTSDADKVAAFGLGGDDYVPKPYSLIELLARVKASFRRCYDMEADQTEFFTFGNVSVDFSSRKVFVSGKQRDMTVKEFDLLAYLIRNRSKAITKEELFDAVWGMDCLGEISTLAVHIRWLREKIEVNASKPEYIKTIWGIGYQFEV